jgi:hypothetical protein
MHTVAGPEPAAAEPAFVALLAAMVGVFARTAADGLLALALTAACLLIGFSLLPRRVRARARLGVPLALSLGLTAAGLIGWLAGSLIGTRAILPVLAVVFAVALRSWRGCATACRRWARTGFLLLRSRLLLTIPLLLGLAALAPQLLLPVNDSDGIRYHLALPKLYLLTGHVAYVPFEYHSALPQLPEMLYLVGLELGRPETAKFLHALAFLAAIAVLASCIHRSRATRSAAIFAALAFAATPVALTLAATAFIDHFAVLHCAVALLAASTNAPAALVGLALGGALGSKLTVAPFAAGVALAVVLRAGRRRALGAAARLAIPVAVILGPFAVRNTLATGDPIFPIGRALLGLKVPGATADTFDYATAFHARTPGFLGITWGLSQGTAETSEVAGWHNLLALFALAIVVYEPRARLFALPIVATLVLGFWYHPPTRYLLPMFLCLAGLAALAVGSVRWRPAIWLAVVPVLASLVTSVSWLFTYQRPFDYLCGRVDREAFLARTVPGWRAARLVNAQPPGGRVMALDFPAPMFFGRPWVCEGIMGRPPLQDWIAHDRDGAEVLRTLQRNDIRFLVVTPGYGGGTPGSLLPLADSRDGLQRVLALRAALRLIETVDGVDVFAVPARRTGT